MTSQLPSLPRYRIGSEAPALDGDLIRLLADCETTMLGHILYWGAMDPEIRPNAGFVPRIAGRALTVQCPGPCSTILHHAIGLATPGDILVIDRLGDRRYACLGDGVAAAAQAQGIVGAIIDGPCTDSEQLAEMEFPVWCRGVSPVTTRLANLGGGARLNISCGGVSVEQGDAILADGDGIFSLPASEAQDIAAIAHRRGQMVAQRRANRPEGVPLGTLTGASELVLSDLG
ncbi:MAG: RraA family protein [Pseudomonadota bacterium]